MTPEEYAAKQAALAAAAGVVAYQLAQFWAQTVLTPLAWVRLLRFIWPEVQRRRQESAVLARQFYDYQRAVYHPQLPRMEIPLQGNDFDVFVRNMEPVRKKMSVQDSPKDAVVKVALQVMREVENAGRRQIIDAVKEDSDVAEVIQFPERKSKFFSDSELADMRRAFGVDPTTRTSWGGSQVEEPLNLRETRRQMRSGGTSRLVRGWARVATGNETCGWCLMLISRGPVYYGADTAGLNLSETAALQMFQASDTETYFDDIDQFMEDWHTGCDCKVIPVFKADDWENSPYGRAASRALGLWNDATSEAEALLDSRGTRVHKFGKKKGDPITKNEEAILALRRRLESGTVNPSEFAGLAA